MKSVQNHGCWELVEKVEVSRGMSCSARCGARVIVRFERKTAHLPYAVELNNQCTRCGDGQAWQVARKALVVELEDLVASGKGDVLGTKPESLNCLLETMMKWL